MILVLSLLASISFSYALPTAKPENRNVITVPPNCPPGQEWILGQCRDIWRKPTADLNDNYPSDVNRNVISVPPNCPPGQEFINGMCRDIWRFMTPTPPILRYARNLNLELRNRRQLKIDEDTLEISDMINRNIISIPNQCPIGYRPDVLGNCREILN